MSIATEPAGDVVRASWRVFLSTYEPLRPELYRYCRHLTGSPWDAEDTVQDALARAFVSLALMTEPPQNPRAWLFRIASNLWLNRIRRRDEILSESAMHDAGITQSDVSQASDPRSLREAAGTLLGQLTPQERAAVVLKDAFGLSLEEAAEVLATTPSAIKAALHRGRASLSDPRAEPRAGGVAPQVLDAFCRAFNERDLEALTATLLESATLEYPGFKIEAGADAIRAGTLKGTLLGCPEAGYEVVTPPRCEAREHRGEWLLLWWSGEEVHAVLRTRLDGDHISQFVSYYHAPEVMGEVCSELGVRYRTHGYRPYDQAQEQQ